MSSEDTGTVQGLTEEIKRLRAGEEDVYTPEVKKTPGQLWKRLLDLDRDRRMKMLRSVMESVERGAKCSLEDHEAELDGRYREVTRLSDDLRQWNTARRLITIFISTLRKNQQATVENGTVADKLELFLKSGAEDPLRLAGRILCGYTWSESGRQFVCAEPVNPGGMHQGEHYAYMRQGASADEELRMKYLEEENDALRDRLGLTRNRRWR